jgi:ATP-binding cassette subfamily B protein
MTSRRLRIDLALHRRLLAQARPQWPAIGALFLLGLLSAPLSLLRPLPLTIAVDSVLGSEPLPAPLARALPFADSDAGVLLGVAVLLLLIALLHQLQDLGSDLLGTVAGERLVLRFRARLFGHLQRLSFAYHDARGVTDSIYRVWYDAPAIQWIAVHGVTPFVTSAITVLAMLYVTARIDPALALVAAGVTPLLALVTRLSRRRLHRRWQEAKELEESALSVVQEALGALRVVKAFGQEERETGRFVRRSGESVRAHVRVALVKQGMQLLVALILASGTAAVLFLGIRHVEAGVLTLGELLLVMGYLAQLYAPLQTISRSVTTLQSSVVSAERAFSLLDQVEDVPDRGGAAPLHRARGAVCFRNVSFGYEPGHPLLRGVTFTVEAGRRIAVVGRTGAGKTTLVSLLPRFYDPTGGAILLDGVDLRAYRLADLRRQFAIVPQETVLFSTSVAENIAYARAGAGEGAIRAAAEAANAHDFIAALPEGYATRVGERGMRLSGGERQRISLARAFLKDAPLLILDEATSSVDTETESAILEALDRLMRGRTVFVVAHRHATLETCDGRLELDGGRIVPASEAVTDETLARAR